MASTKDPLWPAAKCICDELNGSDAGDWDTWTVGQGEQSETNAIARCALAPQVDAASEDIRLFVTPFTLDMLSYDKRSKLSELTFDVFVVADRRITTKDDDDHDALSEQQAKDFLQFRWDLFHWLFCKHEIQTPAIKLKFTSIEDLATVDQLAMQSGVLRTIIACNYDARVCC